MSIIKELYYGNVNPCSPLNHPCSFEHQDAVYRMKGSEALLNNTLNEQEESHFEEFIHYQQKLIALLSAENFEKGFCLGSQLVIAAMGKEQYES